MRASLLADLARRYLFGKSMHRAACLRRIRGGVLGIALSLVPMIMVYEVASAMVEGISVRLLETWSWHVQAESPWGTDLEGLRAAAGKLSTEDQVRLASAEIQGLGLLKGPEGSQGITIRAVEPDLYRRDEGFRSYLRIKEGDFVLDSPSDMVLGDALAQKLGVRTGDKVRLLTYNGSQTNGLPRLSTFTVKGVASTGYQDLDRLWAFVNLDRGASILPADNARSFVGLKLADPYMIPNGVVHRPGLDWESWTESLDNALGRGWYLYGWYEFQAPQFEHFVSTKNMLVFIMVLIMLVASVNVSSTMILFVVEKQHDIAMIRAMGARPGDLALLFLVIGAATGTMGAVLGTLSGAFLSLWINEILGAAEHMINALSRLFQGGSIRILNPEFYLERIPVRLHVPDLVLIALGAFVLSLAASWIPARRAAGLEPSEILRKA